MATGVKCKHCEEAVDSHTQRYHWGPESYGHDGLCCDCMDLSCGMALDDINRERDLVGKPPINKPYPGRGADGKKR